MTMTDWTVKIMRQALKQVDRLPVRVREGLADLIRDMEQGGPVRGNWPNYSVLTGGRHHCHLKKGHPTYVAIWEVANKEINLIEVIYAGTHEKAPY
jgi:mRNA-degrading endonuclease RelE of RelBE toxin-antitoxin system